MNPKDSVGAKKASLRFVPSALILGVGQVMVTGAEKYGPFNWRQQPVSTMTYVEAMLRHLLAYMDGQDNAEDSGLNHLSHIAASAGILLDAEASSTRIEDREIGPGPDILRALDRSQQKTVDIEPKTYPAPHTGELVCYICAHTIGEPADHDLNCPEYASGVALMADLFEPDEQRIYIERWGDGDGDLFSLVGPDDGPYYIGTVTLADDGCFIYRGRHIHPSAAIPETYRDIDRDIAAGLLPYVE